MVMEQRFLPMLSILAKAAGREDRYTSFSGRCFLILFGLNPSIFCRRVSAFNFRLVFILRMSQSESMLIIIALNV